MKKTYGLIGYPLQHSFSKSYFTDKFAKENIDAEFINFEIADLKELNDILHSNPQLQGLCVTIPYKQKVLTYLTAIAADAKQIGAVNSIKISHTKTGTELTGYNTDIYGFTQSLKEFIGNKKLNALILGTGGASKAVAGGLSQLNIDFQLVSRQKKTGQLCYKELDKETMASHQLIINCTPLGTFPNNNTFPPIPYDLLTENHFLYDLVYNPEQTVFLQKGKQRGAKTHNGLKMLHLQAEKSWEIWNR